MSNWIDSQIFEIQHWTKYLFSLRVKSSINMFTAGQFTKLALDINGVKVQRAYSFVNAPNDEILEFYIVLVPDGKLSPRLHKLHFGEQIMIHKQSFGCFTIQAIPKKCKVLWMFATGTAIGPYLSILQYQKNLERFEKIVLIHAVRYSTDLSFLPLMNQLKKQYNGQLYIQTIVSREKNNISLIGRIPELIINKKLEKQIKLDIDPEYSHVMLCGNPQMVRDTQQLLKETRNMKRNLTNKPGHITMENYW
ncbi:MAG: ferredoxin--NADP(+) reductase [Pantoea sp. Brub]|nr:ferredoxin--NADP(+) reductase [Pantoea sp. Brub]